MTAPFMTARRNASTASSSPRTSASLTDRSTTTAPSTTTTSIDDSFPAHEKDIVIDFPGSDSFPTEAVLGQVADAMLVAADGSMRTFRSLYTDDVKDMNRHLQGEDEVDGAVNQDGDIVGRNNTRTLLIFIRHFFCGNCQDYLRALTDIYPDSSALLALPIPTQIIIIGCGSPDLIPMYAEATQCSFPIYSTASLLSPSSISSSPSSSSSSSSSPKPADPRRPSSKSGVQVDVYDPWQLYDRLGMIRTLKLGSTRPKYMASTGLLWNGLKSIVQGLRSGPRKAMKGGDYDRVGGEILFESEKKKEGEEEESSFGSGDERRWKVVWCHRMKTTRDHTELDDLERLLSSSSPLT